MSFPIDKHRFACICDTFLTFAAAFVPNVWLPRSLITDTILADIEEFAPYREQAVQWLVDQRLLLANDAHTSNLILIPQYTQVFAQQRLPNGIRLAAIYDGVDAIVYTHLSAPYLSSDTTQLLVMLDLGQAIADRAISRQSDLAYELCSLVGRLLLLLEDSDAEQYLLKAQQLEDNRNLRDSSVLHEVLAAIATFAVSPADPAFARPYLNRIAERCMRRFGPDHMVTLEVKAVIQQRYGTDSYN